jgi:hypothetical protein
MKAPKNVTRNNSMKRPRKGKRQDSPTALTMEELAGYPFHCPNCSFTFEDVKSSPFCSLLCKAEAHYVRYWRRCIADGRDKDPRVKEAITIKLAFILGGGYNRRVPESDRRFVIDRDGGRCQICRGPGNEVDHISGSSNDRANLQLLCDACHNKKTVAGFRKITKESDPEKWAKAQALWERAKAAEPQRLCDSEVWESIWEELMRKRSDAATGQAGLFA